MQNGQKPMMVIRERAKRNPAAARHLGIWVTSPAGALGMPGDASDYLLAHEDAPLDDALGMVVWEEGDVVYGVLPSGQQFGPFSTVDEAQKAVESALGGTATANPDGSHTPGPWKAVDEGDQFTVFTKDLKKIVAVVEVGDDGRNVAGADANLTAAAPDLVDALREVMIYGTPEAMAKGAAALAKAGVEPAVLPVRRSRKNPHQPEVERLLAEQGFASSGYSRSGETFYHPRFPGVPVVVGWGPGQNPWHANPHTPGPWESTGGRDIVYQTPGPEYPVEVLEIESKGPVSGLTEVLAWVRTDVDNAILNSHLIAAAPELKADLWEAMSTLNEYLFNPMIKGVPQSIYERARRIVDRAGQSLANAEGGMVGPSDLAMAVAREKKR